MIYLVLLDFLPLLFVFFVKPLLLGLVLALLYTGLYLYKQWRTHTVKTITIVNGLYFALAVVIFLINPQFPVDDYSQLAIYFVLASSTILSLFSGQPFTMQYARQTVSSAVWNHPIYIQINRILTTLWAVLFTVSFLLTLLSVAGIISIIEGAISANILNVVGVIGMTFLPERLQQYYLEQEEWTAPAELKWLPVVSGERPVQANHYDVIIIGSGIGGLTVAVELAKIGAKILVLEQHYLLGGACTTYTRKGGFKFDAGVESISGLGEEGPVNHLLHRHGLQNKVKWLRNTYEFRINNETITIPNDFFAWQNQLCLQFPHETEGIMAIFSEIKTLYNQLYSVFAPNRIFPNPPKNAVEKLLFAENNKEFMRWNETKWGEFLDQFVKDPALRQQISMLTIYIGDMAENTPTMAMIPLMGYFIVGGYRPEGGSGEFSKVLVDKFKEYGGDICNSTDVQRIIIEQNEVKGVQTKHGELFAPIIISNADPRITYEQLIGVEHLSKKYVKMVRGLEPSMSLFVWTAGLTYRFQNHHLLYYHLPFPIKLQTLDLVIKKVGIHSASAIDRTLAPENKDTVTINIVTNHCASQFKQMSEQEYEALKAEIDKVCRQILAEIDKAAASQILFTEVATPKTIEHYLRTYEGSIYSIKRKGKFAFPQIKSPIHGLYFVGASMNYGPGVEAVVISGGEVVEQLEGFFAERENLEVIGG